MDNVWFAADWRSGVGPRWFPPATDTAATGMGYLGGSVARVDQEDVGGIYMLPYTEKMRDLQMLAPKAHFQLARRSGRRGQK